MAKVVLLLSDKRSGSTMIQDALCQHKDVRHVDYSPHTYHETHHWLKGAVMLGMAPDQFSGNKVYEGYGSRSNARAYMIDCITGNVPEFTVPDDDRELIFSGWEALCEKFSTPVFFEKSPQFLAHWASLSLILEWIERTDFDVKIIGLTRNPLSVMYSAEKLFYSNPEKRQFGWAEIQKNLLAFQERLSEGSYLQVKYEDIIKNPKLAFEGVCSFIGVPLDSEIGRGVHAKSIDKWRDDPEFDLVLDERVAAMAKVFGYSDDELFNPPKPGVTGWKSMVRKVTGKRKLFLARLQDRLIRPFSIKNRHR